MASKAVDGDRSKFRRPLRLTNFNYKLNENDVYIVLNNYDLKVFTIKFIIILL